MPGTTPNLQLPYPTPDDTVDVPRDVRALAEKLDPLGIAPVGSVLLWLTAVAPLNYLLMQGQKVAAATYPQLAALLGQDAQSQVTIPDMRDVFPVGAGATMGLGAVGGAAAVQLTDRQSGMRTHNHGGASGASDRSLSHAHGLAIPGVTNVATLQQIGNGVFMGLQNVAGGSGWWNGDGVGVSNAPAPDHLHAIAAEGASWALETHENRPPFRALNFIIRAG